jgi:hypothetical protein
MNNKEVNDDLENNLSSKMKQLQKAPMGKSHKIKIHTQEISNNLSSPCVISESNAN